MVKNSELFEAAKKLKPNDVIEFRVLMRRPEIDEVRSARIASMGVAADKEQVNITYVPCKRQNSVQCGFGCTFVTPHDDNANAKHKWGWQWIKVVGTEEPRKWPSGPSLYKNPGYDLVNM